MVKMDFICSFVDSYSAQTVAADPSSLSFLTNQLNKCNLDEQDTDHQLGAGDGKC